MNFETNIYAFIEKLQEFDYQIESIERIWDIIFPDKYNKWHRVKVIKYNEVYYIALDDDDLATLEVVLNKSVQVQLSFGASPFGYQENNDKIIAKWDGLISALHMWLRKVNRDWIKANKLAREYYPLNRRRGYVPNSLIRASLPDLYRIDNDLGKRKVNKFVKMAESDYFRQDKNTTRESMTAKDYFEYCKIAYLAGRREDDPIYENLSGRKMYERYADGRHEGLLDIPMNSKQAFAAWLDGKQPKRTSGGHPWEIKRGGNTTHIDLYVSRPSYYVKEGFKVTLAGASIGRLKETICMFLALYDAGLPISIANPESIRKRLLAQDNIGIVPCHQSLHRANQSFREDEDVFDVLYFDGLGRYKTRVKPFITWEPLPIFKPKE